MVQLCHSRAAVKYDLELIGKRVRPGIAGSYVLYPCLNAQKDELFFEAQDSKETTPPWIYSINILETKHQPKKIVEGQAPSINTNGSMLAYYRHPNELWVFALETGERRKIANDIADNYPAVWYSENDLLYSTKENRLVTINSTIGVKKYTGIEGVAPSALSHKKGKVLCSSDARKIYLYSPDINKLEVIKESSFSIGSSFVWSPGGDSFLYTRQTFFKQLQLNEGHDLFLYSLKNGKEKKILEDVALFGGVLIPEKNSRVGWVERAKPRKSGEPGLTF